VLLLYISGDSPPARLEINQRALISEVAQVCGDLVEVEVAELLAVYYPARDLEALERSELARVRSEFELLAVGLHPGEFPYVGPYTRAVGEKRDRVFHDPSRPALPFGVLIAEVGAVVYARYAEIAYFAAAPPMFPSETIVIRTATAADDKRTFLMACILL